MLKKLPPQQVLLSNLAPGDLIKPFPAADVRDDALWVRGGYIESCLLHSISHIVQCGVVCTVIDVKTNFVLVSSGAGLKKIDEFEISNWQKIDACNS